MKKFGITCLILLLILGISCAAYAATQKAAAVATTDKLQVSIKDPNKTIAAKAERGAVNVLYGWTEVPTRIYNITKETKNPIWGLATGAWQGTCNAVARTLSGIMDVVTCCADSDKKPYIQPSMGEK